MKFFGIPSPALTSGPPLTEAWQALLALVKDKNYRASLGRLARYCSAMDIPPQDLGKEALLGFHEALEAEGGVKDPRIIVRHVTAYWNYHLTRVESWPPVHLETPFPSGRYKVSLSDLPAQLQLEIAAWQESRLGGDILSLDKFATKSRPKTVGHQTDQILRYVGLIVKHNLAEVSALKNLKALLEPRLVQAALSILLKRYKRSTGYVHQYAYLLAGIARHHTDCTPAEVKQLSTLAANLRSELKFGMTPKNRRLLRPFNNPENVKKLMRFPNDERERGRTEPNPYRHAKFYERALVADILIHGALRIENVAMLRIDRNMRKHGGSYILAYAGDEMKNGHPHEIELPAWMSDHLEKFISKYRPRLDGAEGPYLFPGKIDGARHYSAIRTEFSRAIKRRCGLEVNPHLMRHLTSKMALDRDPGLLLVVSRRLGHRRVETTEKAYLEGDSLAASRTYNETFANTSGRIKSSRLK